jgi:hypothetical protein
MITISEWRGHVVVEGNWKWAINSPTPLLGTVIS